METRKGSLTDVATSVIVNKSEKEIEKIRQEQIVRRTGTLEDSISNMINPKQEENSDTG